MDKGLTDKLSQLKKNEILTLVEALWDSIASPPKVVELPGHHKEIIKKGLKRLNRIHNLDEAGRKSVKNIYKLQCLFH